MDNLDNAYEEPDADTPKREATLRLAITEARYHQALDKLQTHAAEQSSAQVRADEFYDIMRQEMACLVNETWTVGPTLQL
ncbi:hypothetical protein N8785_00525 [Planktomarina temperata]|nr:hypothetical protein [Planktomarina temperata]